MGLLELIGYILLVIAAAGTVFGGTLYRHAPHRGPLLGYTLGVSLVATLWALFAGIAYIRGGMGLGYDFFYRACWVGWFGIPVIYGLVQRLRGDTGVCRLITPSLFLFWGVVYLLTFTTDLFESQPVSLIPFVDRQEKLEILFRVIGVGQIIWVMAALNSLRLASSGGMKQKLNFFLSGVLIFAGGAGIISGILPLVGHQGLDPSLGVIFSLPWLALTYYAISRHRLFDLQVVLSNFLALFVLSIILASSHVGVFLLLYHLTGPIPALLLSLTTLAVLLHVTPLKNQAGRVIASIILKGKYDYQELLRESSRAIVTILDLDGLLNRIIEMLRQGFDPGTLLLFLPSREGGFMLRRRLGYGGELSSSDPDLLAVAAYVGRTQRPILKDEAGESLLPSFARFNAEIAVPLIFKGEMRGLFLLGAKGSGEPYLTSDLELLVALTGQIVIALENARLYEQATTDDLTGFLHAGIFRRRLAEEMAQAAASQTPMALMRIDIEHLRQVNIAYGREAGDQVIRDTATVIRSLIRLDNLAARYCGEEFALLLQGMSAEEVDALGEKIRQKVQGLVFEQKAGIDISFGCAVLDPGETMEPEKLLERADHALRQRKRPLKS